MKRRTNPYDQYKRDYRFQIDLPMPEGGWGANRFRLLYEKAETLAPGRHASWCPSGPFNVTRYAFAIEAERDAFSEWIRACGVNWTEPNWFVVGRQ